MVSNNQIWSGLAGGVRAKRLLSASLLNDRLVHNYLFEGPMGIGKFPFALSFARSILCQNNHEGSSCNECDDCRLFNHGRHPDVFVMSRESELVADEARQISNMMMLSPQRAKHKIVVLDGIDRINPSAGNALLKTLEDAPGGSLFILTAHRPEKLLPTILSRSLRVPFYLIPTGDLADTFHNILRADKQDTRQAAELSSGRPGWGIRFLIHPEFRKLYNYGKEIVRESLIKQPLSKIFHKENLIAEFIEESARVFADQDDINGMDGSMIADILDGKPVEFKPVNLFTDSSTKTARHLDALGFVLLGGIFRGMVFEKEIDGEPSRYLKLMEAFTEAPRLLEKYYNKDLVIERFVLTAHGRFNT